jgi:hypothetical protein
MLKQIEEELTSRVRHATWDIGKKPAGNCAAEAHLMVVKEGLDLAAERADFVLV